MLHCLAVKGNEKGFIGNIDWAAVSWVNEVTQVQMDSAGLALHGDGEVLPGPWDEGSGIHLSPQGSVSLHTDSISLIFVESKDRFY